MKSNKKIKVLLVAPALPLIGGQTVQANRLLQKLGEEDEIEIDLQPINPSFFPKLQEIKYVRTVLTSIKYVFDLFRKIPHYDIIHIFSASYFSFILAPIPALLIAKLFGKKTILNYRSGEAEDHLQKSKVAVSLIKKFDAVVTPSGYLVDVFKKFDLEAQSIFNFVDTKKYVFRRRKQLKPIFLSNRNHEELYNVECILKAFSIIQKKYAEAELIVAGDGGQREKLENLARELKLKNIEFLGRVSPDEMPEICNRADIYLNSPNIDNMPGSIIEAFASGLPVVSTGAGGIPYIVSNGETGMLVNINDCKNLAAQALRVLENEELAENLIENARRECEKYSWENVRREWLALYRKLEKEFND